jgi:uncharacterized membrane protein
LEIKYDLFNVEKVQIDDKETHTKHRTVSTTSGSGKDISVSHSTSSYLVEKIYTSNGENTKIFELRDENTNIRRSTETIIANIGNELLAYKNKQEPLHYLDLIKNAKEYSKFDKIGIFFGHLIGAFFLSVPILSIIFAFCLNSGHKDVINGTNIFKYNNLESNHTVYTFFGVLLSHLGFWMGISDNSNFTIALSCIFHLGIIIMWYVQASKFDIDRMREGYKLKVKIEEKVNNLKLGLDEKK